MRRAFGLACGAAWVAALAWPAAPCAAAEPATYPSVQRAFLKEDFDTASTLARTFLSASPDATESPRVRLWLALSLDRLQRSPEALRELDTLKRGLLTKDPLWPEVLYWEGDISRRAFQMVRAKLAFQRLVERYPNSGWTVQARMGLGLIHLHQQAFAAAIESFSEVARRKAGTPLANDAAMFQGLCLLRLGRYAEAVRLLQPLLATAGAGEMAAQIAFYLGESHSGEERFDEAATAYQRAIDEAVTSQWGRLSQFGLAWSYYRAGRCEESVEAFDRYLTQLKPQHPVEALFAQGSCLSQLGRDAQASKTFERIIALDLAHPLAFESGLIVVDSYRRDGDLARATELVHTLLARQPDERVRSQLQLRLGSIALEEGNPLKARTLFELAKSLPDPAIEQAALSGLGDIALYQGQAQEAARWYERSAHAQPGTAQAAYATFQLGRVRLQQGRHDEAAALFERLTHDAEAKRADAARLALVMVHMARDAREEARRGLAEIAARPASEVSGRALYYEALLALGEHDDAEAKRLCEETLARAPRTDEAFHAKLLLLELTEDDERMAEALLALLRGEGLDRGQRAQIAKRLGDLARDAQRFAEAIRWYDEAATLLPALEGEARYRIASCFEEAGDDEAAVARYRAVDDPQWRTRGQLAAAKLLERDERWREAARIYERIAREAGPEAAMARERLAAVRAEERQRDQPPARGARSE